MKQELQLPLRIEGKYCLSVFPRGPGHGIESLPIPVAERAKARVCDRSLAGVAGSNPAGMMDVYKKAKCRTTKTKNQVRMKYRVQENKK